MESALRLLFDAFRYHILYTIAIAFGSVLYKNQTDQFENFFIADHLASNPNDRVLMNQIPNGWIIQNIADGDSVIKDIQQTELFDLLHDQSDAKQYNFLIALVMNMVVQVFPVLNCNIHDNIFGHCQYIGRGDDDSDDENDEEEIVDECSDDDKDEPTHINNNPYILDEVSED